MSNEREISVFSEDVILVTEDGAEVLTAGLPRSPEALEAMVRIAARPVIGHYAHCVRCHWSSVIRVSGLVDEAKKRAEN